MPSGFVVLGALVLLTTQVDPAAAGPRLVVAAPLTAGPEWSPRRLFNAGLSAEESGNLVEACQLYMAARLARRAAFADDLYARGAGLRLLRMLATRDEDAAAAAALFVERSTRDSDLRPLVRVLQRRVDEAHELELVSGTIMSVRFKKSTGTVFIELESEAGEARILASDGPIGPFSAGHEVKVLLRKVHGKAAASWQVVGMAAAGADGWQLLRVDGLPGRPVASSGELLGKHAPRPDVQLIGAQNL